MTGSSASIALKPIAHQCHSVSGPYAMGMCRIHFPSKKYQRKVPAFPLCQKLLLQHFYTAHNRSRKLKRKQSQEIQGLARLQCSKVMFTRNTYINLKQSYCACSDLTCFWQVTEVLNRLETKIQRLDNSSSENEGELLMMGNNGKRNCNIVGYSIYS